MASEMWYNAEVLEFFKENEITPTDLRIYPFTENYAREEFTKRSTIYPRYSTPLFMHENDSSTTFQFRIDLPGDEMPRYITYTFSCGTNKVCIKCRYTITT